MSKSALIAIFAVCIFSVTCHSAAVSSATKDHADSVVVEKCDAVNSKFAKINIFITQPIPQLPFHDPTAQICYDGKTHTRHKSCCSREAEWSFNRTAQANLKEDLKSQNLPLKQVLEAKLSFFQAKFLLMMEIAENRTDIILESVHSVSASDRRPVLQKFFIDLQKFLSGDKNNMAEIVNDFFSELFPHVFYKKELNDRTVMHLTEEYKKCLINVRARIYPQPFGIVPFRIISGLSYTFTIARSFLESIKLAIHALNVTEHLDADESCLKGLTKMGFCADCQGYTSAKPCRGLCLNIMRGCLSKMMEFGPEWDELISSLKVLSLRMKGLSGFQGFLDTYESQVSEALMHALKTQHRYYTKITSTDYCGPVQMVNSTDPISPHADHDMTLKRPTPIEDIYTEIRTFVDGIVSYHGWHAKISDKICNNSNLYEQSLKSGNCWNGKHISLYNEQIPDPYFISQVKYNPEVRVSRVHDFQVAALKDRLTLFRKSISIHVRPDHKAGMQADQGYSGDGYRENTYRGKSYWVTKDDQLADDDGNSASGSGAPGSGKDDDDEDQERTKAEKAGTQTNAGHGHKPESRDPEFEIDNPKSGTEKGHATPRGGADTTIHSPATFTLFSITFLPILYRACQR